MAEVTRDNFRLIGTGGGAIGVRFASVLGLLTLSLIAAGMGAAGVAAGLGCGKGLGSAGAGGGARDEFPCPVARLSVVSMFAQTAKRQSLRLPTSPTHPC